MGLSMDFTSKVSESALNKLSDVVLAQKTEKKSI